MWPGCCATRSQPGAHARIGREIQMRLHARRACRHRARCRRSCSAPPTKKRCASRCDSITPSAAWPCSSRFGSSARRGESAGRCLTMKRGVATYGSWLYCSKNIHCSTCARAEALVGQQRRAFGEIPEDGVGLGKQVPSSSSSVGMRPFAFLPRNSRRARLARVGCRARPSDRACRAARAPGGSCSRCRNRGSRKACPSAPLLFHSGLLLGSAACIRRFYRRAFLIATVAILGYLLLQLLEPLWGPLGWAVILTFLLYPLHEWLTRKLKGSARPPPASSPALHPSSSSRRWSSLRRSLPGRSPR